MIAAVATGQLKEKEHGSHRSADGSSLRSVKGKVKFQNAIKAVVHEKRKVQGEINTYTNNNNFQQF